MLLVRMFRSRGVDSGVPRSKETEDDDEQTGYNEGVDNGGIDGILLNLSEEVSLKPSASEWLEKPAIHT